MNIFSTDTKKTIHPKVQFSSYFNKLKGKNTWDAWNTQSTFSYKPLRIDTSIEEGADFLEGFLNKFEYFKGLYQYTYNGFKEKMQAYFEKIFK